MDIKELVANSRELISQLNSNMVALANEGVQVSLDVDVISRHQIGQAQVRVARLTAEFELKL